MKYNAYTTTIDNIHAPEISVERAIRAARERAAATAAARIRTRYTAAAASLVLAASAGGAIFFLHSESAPPTAPTPAPITATTPADDTESPSQAATQRASQAETQKETETVKPAATEAQASHATEAEPIHPTDAAAAETQRHTEPAVSPTRPTSAPTQAPTQTPTQAATSVLATSKPDTALPIPEDPDIDSSLLCDDGKVYFMIASVAMDRIEGEDAFSDDHLYYIETKFGRWEFNSLPWFFKQAEVPAPGATYYYYYSSDGTILYSEVH